LPNWFFNAFSSNRGVERLFISGEKVIGQQDGQRQFRIMTLFVLFYILAYLIDAIGGHAHFLAGFTGIPHQIIYSLFAFGAMFYLFYRLLKSIAKLGINVKNSFRIKSLSANIIISIVTIAVGLKMSLTIIKIIFESINLVGNPQSLPIANKSMELGIWIILLFQICFVTPIWEEFLFRGLLLRFFQNHFIYTKAILLTALIFALFHYEHKTYGIIIIFIESIFFGWLVIKTNSIMSAVILHCLSNLHSMLYRYMQAPYNSPFDLINMQYSKSFLSYFSGISVTVIGFAILYWGIKMLKKSLILQQNSSVSD
jgi:membrane protease YdiL (CAAX protease family)